MIKLLCGETVSSTVKDNLISFRSDYTNFSEVGSSFCCRTRYQFVFFKPLSYSFEEAIGFDIKASFARVVYYQIRWYKKKCLEKAIQFHGTFHGIKITNWYWMDFIIIVDFDLLLSLQPSTPSLSNLFLFLNLHCISIDWLFCFLI